MAMLAVLDVDDLATPKIQRVKNALDDLTTQTAQTARATASASKGFLDGNAIDDQLKSLSTLNREMAQVRTQAGAWNILSRSMQEGQKVTKTQAAALMDLSGALLSSDTASHKLQYSSMVLAGGLKEGATVTSDLKKRLAETATEFSKANGLIQGTGDASQQAAGKMESLRASTAALAVTFGLIAGSSAAYLANAGQIAARTEVLGTVLGVMTKNLHLGAGEMELQIEKIKKLGITTREATDAVIQFAQAQLKTADSAKLARAAQDLAVVAGMNSSQAFGILVNAIDSSNTRMLRQFGILTNQTKVFSDYAREIGKTADKLTEVERKQAILNKVLDEAKKFTGAYEASMGNVGKAQSSLARYQEEMALAIGNNLLPAMMMVVQVQTKLYKAFLDSGPAVQGAATALLVFASALAAVGAAYAAARFLGIIEMFTKLGVAIKAARVAMATAEAGSLALAVGIKSLAASIGTLTLALGAIAIVLAAAAAAYVYFSGARDRDTAAMEKQTEKQVLQQQAVEEQIETIRRYETQAARTKAEQDSYNKLIDDFQKKHPELVAGIDATTGKLKLNEEGVKALGEQWETYRRQRRKALEDSLKATEAELVAAELARESYEQMGKGYQSFWERLNPFSTKGAVGKAVGFVGGLINDRDVESLNRRVESIRKQIGMLFPEEEIERNAAGARQTARDTLRLIEDDTKSSIAKIKAAGAGNLFEQVEKGFKRVAVLGADGKKTWKEVAMTAEDYAAVVREVEQKVANYEQEQQRRAKQIEQAYKNIQEQAERMTPAMQAQRRAFEDIFGKAFKKGDIEEINRLLQLFGAQMLKLGSPAELTAAGLKNVARAVEELEKRQLEKWAQGVEKNLREAMTAIEGATGEASKKWREELAQSEEEVGIRRAEARKTANEKIEDMDRDLYERLVVSKMKEVDQAIYAERKRVAEIAKAVEKEIEAREKALQAEERAADRRLANIKREIDDIIRLATIKQELYLTELRSALEVAREAGDTAEIRNLEAKIRLYGEALERFKQNAAGLRQLRVQEAEDARASAQARIDAERRANEEIAADQRAAVERQIEGSKRVEQEIRTNYDTMTQAAKSAFISIADAAQQGVVAMLTGQASLKEGLIGIWQSIKQSLLGIFDSIVKAWIQNAAKMATAGGGFDIGKFAGGIFGKGQGGIPGLPGGAPGAPGGDFVGPPAPGGAGGYFGMSRGVGGGMIGGAAGGVVGFGVGMSSGSKTMGVLSGAGTGAATGAMFGGPIGAGIGAGIGAVAGLIGGWLGGKKQAEEAKKMREELLASAGGLENLKKKAEEAGFSLDKLLSTKKPKDLQKEIEKLNKALEEQAKIEALKKAKEGLDDTYTKMITVGKQAQLVGFDIKKLYDAKTIEEFNTEQEKLNKLLEDQQKRLAGLQMAASGLASRVKGLTGFLERSVEDWFKEFSDENRERFEKDFKAAGEAGFKGSEFEFARQNAEKYGLSLERLNERQARVSESVQRIGQYAMATFGGILRETGDIMQAFGAVAGPLDELAAIMEQTGVKAEGALGYLMGFRDTIRNNEDVAASLSGINQILLGLADSGRLTVDMFNTLGADAAEQWRIMEERGVAADQALLLMQPTLQTLYEAQKNYGFAADETTQKLINMGVEQGLVGDQFQDVNSKMLDMLMIIAEALGATIPDAYKRQSQAAADAGAAGQQAAQDTAAGLEEQARQTEEAYKKWYALEKELNRVDTSGVDGLADAVGDLPDRFADAADAAWDASQEIQDAMAAAQPDVDAISLGHSPGGLKEIRIKLREAIESLREFRAAGRENLRGVEDSVNSVVDSMGEVKPATEDVFKGDRQGDPFAEETTPRAVQVVPSGNGEPQPKEEQPATPAVQVVLQPEFKIDTIDAAGMEAAVREKIGPQIITQMRSNTDQLTVEIGRALDRYFGGRKTA